MIQHVRERGIALLLVLWVFMTLGVVALDFSRYIRDDAMATINYADETRGYYTAVAGVNFALWQAKLGRIWIPPPPGTPAGLQDDLAVQEGDHRLIDKDGDGRPENLMILGEWFQGPAVGDGLFQVQVTDEDAKVSINEASDDVLKAVITSLVRGTTNVTEGIGRAEERQIDDIMENIRAWRDPSGAGEGIGQGGNERRFDLRRRSKITWFTFSEELLAVPGITPDLFYGHDDVPGLADVISPFSRREMPNGATMSPQLHELLGEQIVGLLAPGVATGSLSVVRIRACGDVRNARNQSRIEAIVRLEAGGPGAPKMLRWIDRAPAWPDAQGCQLKETEAAA